MSQMEISPRDQERSEKREIIREGSQRETPTKTMDQEHAYAPHSLKTYLKQESIRKMTVDTLNNTHKEQVFSTTVFNPLTHGHHDLHIKNFCKLRNHFLKLEYHYFDYDWFPNVNRYDPSTLTDFNELSFIPGRLEYTLKHQMADTKAHKLQGAHCKLEVD